MKQQLTDLHSSDEKQEDPENQKDKNTSSRNNLKPSRRKIANPVVGIAEIGGPARLEPTRYGDWEVNGRCSDF